MQTSKKQTKTRKLLYIITVCCTDAYEKYSFMAVVK